MKNLVAGSLLGGGVNLAFLSVLPSPQGVDRALELLIVPTMGLFTQIGLMLFNDWRERRKARRK